jgi:uncharacterized membrane protein|tara:strand:- start:735 stop:944 length:210 start_codon:yes stop_codon:yes gene_type:complete
MQSKLFSFIESVTNVVVGFVVAVLANILVLPLFGFYPNLGEATSIGVIFTIISLCRSYIIRRLFNKIKR